MRLLRYGPAGAEKPGLLDDFGQIRDLSQVVGDFAGPTVSLRQIEALSAVSLDELPIVEGEQRVGPCVASMPNFHCVGLNYAKHAAETGGEPPPEPILFSKATSSLCGPNDPIIQPKDSTQLDYEVELGVIIGADATHIAEADALSIVSGYCVINDVSERNFQIRRSGQWVKGKSSPNFGPVGPWIVTADEVEDPQNLPLWLDVNGDTRQLSNTSDMIFSVAEIISYMSRFMKLLPGDVIATGTPEGVAMGMDPREYLQPGDEVHLGVEGLGEQRQTVVAFGEA
ncbi:MAG: fumarylacetoacetate hydrolase family protein [Pseudomonadota bacterium]